MRGRFSGLPKRASAIGVALVCGAGLWAQEPPTRAGRILQARAAKASRLEPEHNSGFEKKLLKLKDKRLLQAASESPGDGLKPAIGGVTSGQGFAVGVRYLLRDREKDNWRFNAAAFASISKSFKVQADLTLPEFLSPRVDLEFSGRHRRLTRVDYYGPGAKSLLENRTSYLKEDTSADAKVRYRPLGGDLSVGARAGILAVNTGRGRRTGTPSPEDLFSSAAAAGLDDQTNFLRTGGFLEFDTREPTTSGARSGALVSLEFSDFSDQGLGRYGFQQLDAEVQKYYSFLNGKRVFVVRGEVATTFTDSDHRVPFYLQPYLGGAYEMRGFPNYRFYGDHSMVTNFEYRWEAFSGLDLALFMDAGKVADRRADLDFSDLETAAGFGFRFNGRNQTFMRLDVAFSQEGTQIWFRWRGPFRRRCATC